MRAARCARACWAPPPVLAVASLRLHAPGVGADYEAARRHRPGGAGRWKRAPRAMHDRSEGSDDAGMTIDERIDRTDQRSRFLDRRGAAAAPRRPGGAPP